MGPPGHGSRFGPAQRGLDVKQVEVHDTAHS
jgi:hypothetical protein